MNDHRLVALRGSHLVTLFLCIAAGVSIYFASRSLLLAMTRTSRLPLGDIWWFYRDYFSYIDGTYSFWHLFDRHNEHVIVTTRLAMFVDAIWFKASGKFVLFVSYASAAVTAFLLGWLAARPSKWETAGLTVSLLGMTWALIQLDNLTLPFQAVFPLVHAFALTTLMALRQGLTVDRRWYAMAFFADFLAVFTAGSGVLLGAAALALAIWLRKVDRVFIGFIAYHVSLVALFSWLISGPGLPTNDGLPPLRQAAIYFTMFVGNFVLQPAWAVPVGTLVGAGSVMLFTLLTMRAITRRPPLPGEIAVLAAFALFIVIEAAGATLSRTHFGLEQALSLKYTTCTLLLAATLVAVGWRLSSKTPTRLGTVLAMGLIVYVANPRAAELGWRKRNSEMDAIARKIRNGYLPPSAHAELFVEAPLLEALIWRFKAAGLGPFDGRSLLHDDPGVETFRQENPGKRFSHAEAAAVAEAGLPAAGGVRFGHFELLGAVMTPAREGIELKLAWRCVSAAVLDRLVAVHFVDDSGKILAQADFPQDVGRASVMAGAEWVDRVFAPQEKLAGAVKVAIALYTPGQDLVIIDRGPRDWDQHRLLLPLDKVQAGMKATR